MKLSIYRPYRKIAFVTLLTLLSGLSVKAQEIPYLAPACDNEPMLSQPPGSGEYLRNKTCKTVMILPRPESPMTVRTLAPNGNLLQCGTLKILIASREKEAARLDRIKDLAEREKDIKTRERLKSDAERIGELLKEPIPLGDLEGATVQVVFSAGVDPLDVKEYIDRNIGIIRQVKFVPSPISKGMLSFSAPRKTPGAAVLDVQIPGVTREGDAYTVLGIGSKSGLVTFSLLGACPLLGFPSASADLSKIRVDPSGSNIAIAANYTYSIPFMVSQGYKASLNMRMFLNALISNYKTRGQFTLREVYAKSVNASGTSGFQLALHDTTGSAQEKDYIEKIREDVYLRMASELTAQLERVGVIAHPNTSAAPDAPSGGTVARTIGTIHKCHSDSFVGITYNQSCWSEPWVIAEWVDGTSSLENRNLINLDFTVEESVENESLQNRAYTSSLVFKAAPSKNEL